MEITIKNALVVNEGEKAEKDIFIKNGRIEKLGSNLAAEGKVIDAAGKLLIPGMIDDQVHFREPGLTHKGNMETESRAAVAGGITSFMDMPNVNPTTTTIEALKNKYEMAKGRTYGNHSFYMGASNDNIEEIKKLNSNDTCGIKVFMGASTGNMLVDDETALNGIFSNSKESIVVTHCEDSPMIKANEALFTEKYGEEIPFHLHPEIRSAEACFKSSSFAIGLAKKHNTKLHVLHLTTAKEMDHFTAGPIEKKRITAEVCTHHLFFSEEDYERLGARIKCNPAVKKASDRAALIDAVNSGKIDIIATDHAPHLLDEKNRPYMKSSAGLPLVQHAVTSTLELYHKGLISLETFVEKTSHNVAKRYDIVDRGFIREGYFADLTMIDLHGKTKCEDELALSKCGWTPFTGLEFESQIVTTIVNGIPVFENGNFTDHKPVGIPLVFNRI